MKVLCSILASLVCLISAGAFAQTADELVAKNLQAKGGIEKMKAIKSVRMTGQFDASGFKATIGQESKRPEMVRETFIGRRRHANPFRNLPAGEDRGGQVGTGRAACTFTALSSVIRSTVSPL